MINITHNPAIAPAVGQPETFDIKGLTLQQVAALLILTGLASGGYGSAIYDQLLAVLKIDNDDVYELVKLFPAVHVDERLVKQLLAKRQK